MARKRFPTFSPNKTQVRLTVRGRWFFSRYEYTMYTVCTQFTYSIILSVPYSNQWSIFPTEGSLRLA